MLASPPKRLLPYKLTLSALPGETENLRSPFHTRSIRLLTQETQHLSLPSSYSFEKWLMQMILSSSGPCFSHRYPTMQTNKTFSEDPEKFTGLHTLLMAFNLVWQDACYSGFLLHNTRKRKDTKASRHANDEAFVVILSGNEPIKVLCESQEGLKWNCNMGWRIQMEVVSPDYLNGYT